MSEKAQGSWRASGLAGLTGKRGCSEKKLGSFRKRHLLWLLSICVNHWVRLVIPVLWAVKRRNRAWGDWPATRMEAPRGGIGFVSSAASCFGSFGPGLKIGFVWYFFGCVAAELGKRARRSRSSRWGAAQRPRSVDWGVGMDEFDFFPVTSVAEIRKDLLETNGLFEKHRRSCGGLLQRPQKARVDAACNREQIARATLTCPQVSRLLHQAIPGK
jgi:hypothetical protein